MSAGPLVSYLLLVVIGRVVLATLLGFAIAYALAESWTGRILLTPVIAALLYAAWLGVDRLRRREQS